MAKDEGAGSDQDESQHTHPAATARPSPLLAYRSFRHFAPLPASAMTGCAELGLNLFGVKGGTRGSFGPAPRLEVVSDPDALHLGVLAHRLEAHLSPDAAHLHPAERRGGVDQFLRVYPPHSPSGLSPPSLGAPPGPWSKAPPPALP